MYRTTTPTVDAIKKIQGISWNELTKLIELNLLCEFGEMLYSIYTYRIGHSNPIIYREESLRAVTHVYILNGDDPLKNVMSLCSQVRHN